jgi:ABC-type Na+ efflux pump permease subunit
MPLPKLLRDRSRPAQVLLGGVLPAAIGALAGLMVGISAAGYWAIAAVAAIGGILAGFEHRDGWGGADRGMVGGAIFAIALLLIHDLTGKHAKVSLGSSSIVFVIFVTILSILLGALGGRLARAQRERAGIFITDEHLAE